MDEPLPPLPTPRQRQRTVVSGRPHRRRIGLRAGWALFGAILGGIAVWLAMEFADKVAEPPEPPEPRLLGTWYSDAGATIADRRMTETISDQDELDLRRKYFKTAVTYTADTMTMQIGDDEPATRPYTVVSTDANGAKIRFYFAPKDREEEVRIRFERGEPVLARGEGPARQRVLPADPVNCQRRGRDSNPRTPCPVVGFQDRCIRPLCHPSGGVRIVPVFRLPTKISRRKWTIVASFIPDRQ